MYNTKEQIAKTIEQTDNALLVYQDKNGQYQIAAMCTQAGEVIEMASFVASRVDMAADHLLIGD